VQEGGLAVGHVLAPIHWGGRLAARPKQSGGYGQMQVRTPLPPSLFLAAGFLTNTISVYQITEYVVVVSCFLI
jgi:hypothetical protein